MAERLLTPSKITAWLGCAHFLTLRHEVEAGTLTVERSPFGEMAQLLLDKGMEHEGQVLEAYKAEGRSVFEVPAQDKEHRESFAGWVARVGNPMTDGYDVIFQMPFVHDGIRGIADFLVRTVDPITGAVTYEPVDAKLARNEAKPGHVLQLCFYAEAIHALTGTWPEHVRIALGSGRVETIRVDDVLPYWRRLRSQLVEVTNAEIPADTYPEPCDHCQFCEFELLCEERWRTADSLVHVAGVHKTYRHTLNADGVTTIAGLATLDRPVAGLDDVRSDRLVRQARLQVEARTHPDDPPPFELVETTSPTPVDPATATAPGDPDPKLVGFHALPAPDDGDIFLDFEGHPFWRADLGLFFLFGWIERDTASGEWKFEALWAHDEVEEADATRALVDYLAERRRQYPGMHVYHYNHTERSSLVRLSQQHGVVELELEQLVQTGLFVDLLEVIRGAMQVGVESYGLKHIERLTGYERGHEIDRGAGAVVEYERWMADPAQGFLDRIASYNEDDVRATRAVRDWLVEHRPPSIAWRAPVTTGYTADPELDERIEKLQRFDPGTPEHLMGDLLGYWRREKAVVSANCVRLSVAPEADQLESPSVIAGLTFLGTEEVLTPTGKVAKWPAGVFSFPPQVIDADIRPEAKMMEAVEQYDWAFFEVLDIDREQGRLWLNWNESVQAKGVIPRAVVHYSWIPEGAKKDALTTLADEMLAGDATRVGHEMVRRSLPSFVLGAGPAGGAFSGDLDDICAWAPGLDGSFVPIQGPPGTGKTYTGAHIVRRLVQEGKRVGITAMSHSAIDNLLAAVVKCFAEAGESAELRAVRKPKDGWSGTGLPGVVYAGDGKKCATGDFNVIAGTGWLFASEAMQDHPVDVLLVDEAGQLGLADTLAATVSARNVILLGDPQQLAQVAQASHPDGAGASALEHLLGDDRTAQPDRGVLLDVTYRMHPDVCRFISDVSYEGKLTSHQSCVGQSTAAGTGLRWIESTHTGCSTESAPEAELVAETIRDLLGHDWTDQKGITRPLTVDDFIVVTPYNDQRRLIGRVLEEDAALAGVEVGTVDKFQGREAAVVVFSMATSSSEFMPRDSAFLFSKNRLNVAISRARCLAHLICTDELLNTRARTVEEMTLISALCSFVEHAS